MQKTTTMLLIGLALALVGSLLITKQNVLVQLGGVVLGVIGALCIIISLVQGRGKFSG